MTTLFRIELMCPVCVRAFSSQAALTAGRSARMRTDFHEQTAGVQPLPYLVHTCPACGYTGGHRDFDAATGVPLTLASHIWCELAPKLHGGAVTGSEKYELAARIALWRGAGSDQVGELLLRAAWCCVNEGDVEAERYFRRHAAWAFEAALAGWDSITPEMRATLTYLVGEVWRRAGDLRAAAEWFGRVRSEVVALPRQRWIVEAAERQRDDPREWFDGDVEGDRPVAPFGRSVHRPAVIERGRCRDAALARLLRRAVAATRRIVATVAGRVSRPTSRPAAARGIVRLATSITARRR